MTFNLTAIRSIFVLALAVGVTALTMSAGSHTASADNESDLRVTFTKWVTGFPNLTGVAGGDIGESTFNGEVLKRDPTVDNGRVTEVQALYSFVAGNDRSFTAMVYVRQTLGAAEINGIVIKGWMEGARVQGEYRVITCDEAANHVCFQGNLRLSEENLG